MTYSGATHRDLKGNYQITKGGAEPWAVGFQAEGLWQHSLSLGMTCKLETKSVAAGL